MERRDENPQPKRRALAPFRRALTRGLAILLPPLLTVVILLWVWNTVALYLLMPAENLAKQALTAYYDAHIIPASAADEAETIDGVPFIDGEPYRQTGDGQFIPLAYFLYVESQIGLGPWTNTADAALSEYIDRKWLPRSVVIPVFLCAFLLGLYLLGKFLAAGVGRLFWNQFERFIIRLPLVRNVYTSVKQVTDFVFSERELQYTRVVGIEYPRKGTWQLAFVTGESIGDIAAAANEPVISVLVPTSPMPFTGFTVTVKRSETIDLSITIEQALQFIVSCGVVAPPHEFSRAVEARGRETDPRLIDGPQDD